VRLLKLLLGILLLPACAAITMTALAIRMAEKK